MSACLALEEPAQGRLTWAPRAPSPSRQLLKHFGQLRARTGGHESTRFPTRVEAGVARLRRRPPSRIRARARVNPYVRHVLARRLKACGRDRARIHQHIHGQDGDDPASSSACARIRNPSRSAARGISEISRTSEEIPVASKRKPPAGARDEDGTPRARRRRRAEALRTKDSLQQRRGPSGQHDAVLGRRPAKDVSASAAKRRRCSCRRAARGAGRVPHLLDTLARNGRET